MKRKFDFTGGVALVTGSASGIGRATALAFAREGADVVMSDVQVELGRQVAQEAQEFGRKVLFVPADVSNENDVKNLMDQTFKNFGRLDCAFNNAGTEGQPNLTHLCSTENFDKIISVNLKSVWLCMKYQIPQMLKQEGGTIVNCASVAGLVGFASAPAYVASKHGIVGLTKTAALEYAKSNIRVNAVCPGIIQTPMIDRFTKGQAYLQQQLVAGEPVGRVGTPDEVAEAVLWLSSHSSSFVTGQALAVDGGWVAQ